MTQREDNPTSFRVNNSLLFLCMSQSCACNHECVESSSLIPVKAAKPISPEINSLRLQVSFTKREIKVRISICPFLLRVLPCYFAESCRIYLYCKIQCDFMVLSLRLNATASLPCRVVLQPIKRKLLFHEVKEALDRPFVCMKRAQRSLYFDQAR